MALLLAKGDDFNTWRGVEEFSTAYRDAAVQLASRRDPAAIAVTLVELEELLGAAEEVNRHAGVELEQVLLDLAAAADLSALRLLQTRWYEACYRHFRHFRSPNAFFNLSFRFLSAFAARCFQLAADQLAEPLPAAALFVFGPAGRHEPTRHCRVQLGLFWDGDQRHETLMDRLGQELTAWFRVCGVILEENVTPLQSEWRGNLDSWRRRFEQAAQREERSALIELLRLADRAPLFSTGGAAEAFSSLCNDYLLRRPFVGNLVERCTALSNGITMMGHLKLEKSGPHRNSFAMLDHGLLPLAAAVTAICLMQGVSIEGTPERLRQLVRIGKLDVVLAERALHAWHFFSRQRLMLELEAETGLDCRDIMYLDPVSLSPVELEQLHSALETVGDLQRYMQVCYGSYV